MEQYLQIARHRHAEFLRRNSSSASSAKSESTSSESVNQVNNDVSLDFNPKMVSLDSNASPKSEEQDSDLALALALQREELDLLSSASSTSITSIKLSQEDSLIDLSDDTDFTSSSSSTFSSSSSARKKSTLTLPDVPDHQLLFQRNHISNLSSSANSQALRLQDIFKTDASTGSIVSALICNFHFDVEWMVAQLPVLASLPHVHIVNGEDMDSILARVLIPNAQIHRPHLPLPYGTHHTKMFILICEHLVRVCIHTANMVECDWLAKNQLIWMQDFPRKLSSGPSDAFASSSAAASSSSSYFSSKFSRTASGPFSSSSSASTSLSLSSASASSGSSFHGGVSFEDDLIDYLFHYPSTLHPFVRSLRQFDFSAAKVALVASVPGYHKDSALSRFGHMRLRRLLTNLHQRQSTDEQISEFRFAPIVCQFSSLGSLDEKWLYGEFRASLAPSSGSVEIRCVWPTVEDVRQSIEGYAAGGSIPAPKANMKEFLRPHLRRWIGVDARGSAMPHCKSYLRPNADGQTAWMLVTSANLSKAAWGCLQKNNSQLQIRSYELGVLFLPNRFAPASSSNSSAAVTESSSSSSSTPVLGKRKSSSTSENPVRFFWNASALKRAVSSAVPPSPPPSPPHPTVSSSSTSSQSSSSSSSSSSLESATSSSMLGENPSNFFLCPIVYDPLSSGYSSADVPWVVDGVFSNPDVFGRTWPPSF